MRKKLKTAATAILLAALIMTLSCNRTVTTDVKVPSADEQGQNTKEQSEPQMSEEEKALNEQKTKIAEREELENTRKSQQGEFYVPLIPIEEEEEKKTIEVKALYATGHTAGSEIDKNRIDDYSAYVKALAEGDVEKASELSVKAEEATRFERIIGIAVATEINAVVINVKDDDGYVTYESSVDIVERMNEGVPVQIKDVKTMLRVLKEYGVYTIGRIVTFKDKNFAVENPEHAIQLKEGGTWLDPNSGNIPWVNPFDKYVWEYNITIAKEAALLGFDEIQFDYVRFPDGAKSYNPITEFPGRQGRDKDEAIAEFLSFASEELKPYNVNVGADVFGIITRTWDDYPEDIGQTWILMGQHVDNICPMVYPSHYGPGWYNQDDPNSHPYEVVRGAMMEAAEKNSSMMQPPTVRPWIQDFNWAGVEYGPDKVRAQIIAAKELGYSEYMIWNPSNSYDPYSFMPGKEEQKTVYPLDTGERDLAGRTPAEAADKYLSGEQYGRYSYMYLMTPKNERTEDFDEFQASVEQKGEVLVNYTIHGYEIDPSDTNKASVTLNYIYDVQGNDSTETVEKNGAVWEAVREDGIWKIKKTIDM